MQNQFAHANLSIFHLHEDLGPQEECLHKSLKSQMVQSQAGVLFVMSLRCRGCLSAVLLPCIPHTVGWTCNSPREPQAPKTFSGVSHWSQRCDYSSETHTWGSSTWHGPSADSNGLQQHAGGYKLQKTSTCGKAQVAKVWYCECLCFSPRWLWEVCSCCNLAVLSSISRGKKAICWFVHLWLSDLLNCPLLWFQTW